MLTVPPRYLAVDLGAESGRIMLGELVGDRLILEETHRFRNGVVPLQGTLRWDLLGLWREINEGLRQALAEQPEVRSISVDSWGVDYVLMRGSEPMLGPAYHYRDPRAQGPYERLRKDPGEAFIYEKTGIQFMPLNTLYQLVADCERDPDWVRSADGMLMIADWVHWALTGRRTMEETNASTTQLYDPVRRTWAWELIDRLKLPRALFSAERVEPGTVLGPLSDVVLRSWGLEAGRGRPQVVACCTHDTGSAVAAVPSTSEDGWAYLSSGTWSLIGVELKEPLLSEKARQANFTNELGFGRTVRLLRNVVGLWLLQECRRIWAESGTKHDYAEITRLADEARPFGSFIHPDDPRFHCPEDMPREIQRFCAETGQIVPKAPGEIARCVFESLALLYSKRIEELEGITQRRIHTVHIVGGGSQNRLLNQLTASATGRTVLAGPVEATAIGNVLVQAIAMGDLPDLATARSVVRQSFNLERFDPAEHQAWDKARARFSALR